VISRALAALVVPLLLAGVARAQSNADPAIDLKLGDLTDLTALGRSGTFPDGVNGCALETTACNLGTKRISWQAAMDPDHPFICFLVARESGGRFRQISDRSYVKHGFFALSANFCGSCQGTDGTTLGIGCSDTYATDNNGDNFWLGPPQELDPWLGRWTPACSHFDRGEPPVAPPGDCNGIRSLTQSQAQALGPVGHRIHVRDAELLVPGAFWYQGMYVIETEGEAKRGDDLGSRAFTPSWNGARWILATSGALLHGSILQRWSGATLDSATNGGDDGRLYVATKVTGPVDGFYHYEIAVHDRDNARGVSSLHVPLCAGARVQALGFADVDTDPSNDWSAARAGGELVFSGAANPLPWNTIYNFWFDSDAAPVAAPFALDQAAPGPGLASVAVTGRAPLGLFNVFTGPGCALDSPPTLHALGTPPRATLGNASFALESRGNAPLQPSFLYFSRQPGPVVFHGCSLWLGAPSLLVSTVQSDANGVAVHAAPIPNDVALEGLDAYLQAVGRDPSHGPLFHSFELSDGLLVRTGNALVDCP
jgi:hypothetical protein